MDQIAGASYCIYSSMREEDPRMWAIFLLSGMFLIDLLSVCYFIEDALSIKLISGLGDLFFISIAIGILIVNFSYYSEARMKIAVEEFRKKSVVLQNIWKAVVLVLFLGPLAVRMFFG